MNQEPLSLFPAPPPKPPVCACARVVLVMVVLFTKQESQQIPR